MRGTGFNEVMVLLSMVLYILMLIGGVAAVVIFMRAVVRISHSTARISQRLDDMAAARNGPPRP